MTSLNVCTFFIYFFIQFCDCPRCLVISARGTRYCDIKMSLRIGCKDKISNIAIIGSGIAGSSTAYFLKELADSHNKNIRLTVYLFVFIPITMEDLNEIIILVDARRMWK